jgi:hypothetical protein
MADGGAYRWLGIAPAPDPARLDAIDAAWDDAGVDAFAEPARAAAVERLERALAAARTGDLTEAHAQLTHARAALEGLDPGTLQPRRGLLGLFDSRGRRLKRFRLAYEGVARSVGDVAADLAGRIDAGARRSEGLDGAWTALREAVAELDAWLAAAARRPSVEGDGLDARRATLETVRVAALRGLPLVRGVQNADLRALGALGPCVEGVAAWRDDWKDALGLSRRRPKKVRPDRDRLLRLRDDLIGRIDRALAELATTRPRRADIEGRLADLRKPL